MPISVNMMSKTLILTSKHKSIEKLFEENFWKTFLGWSIV